MRAGATAGDGARLAVVGAGRWGSVVARRIAADPGLRLVAVVDPAPGAAAEAAGGSGAAACLGLDELPGAVDGAVVATPPGVHVASAIGLLERGIPALIEKPLAPDLAGARALARAAERTRSLVQPAFQERFNPGVRACGGGLLGPRFVEAQRLAPFAARALDTDVVLDLMVHDLDLCLWLAGPDVTEVRAVGVPVLTDQVDMANVRIEWAGGAVAVLSASRASPRPVRSFRAFSSAGYHSVDLLAGTAYRALRVPAGPGSEVRFAIAAEGLAPPAEDALGAQLRAFAAACRGEAPPPVTLEEGIAALALALRVRERIGQASSPATRG